MGSFADTTAAIKNILENDADLAAFCAANFSNALTVLTRYQKRTEVNSSDLPVIIMTRPSRRKRDGLNRRVDSTHVLRLYYGFTTEDKDGALDLFVQFEELIDAALQKDRTIAGTAADIEFESSENDEGYFAPIYFGVSDYGVKKRA